MKKAVSFTQTAVVALLVFCYAGCNTAPQAVIEPAVLPAASLSEDLSAAQANLPAEAPSIPVTAPEPAPSTLGAQVTALSDWMEAPRSVPCNEVAGKMNVKEQDPLLYEPSMPLEMALEKCFYGFAPRPVKHQYQYLLVWLWYAPPQNHENKSGSWHHFALTPYPAGNDFKIFLAGNRHYANPADSNALFYLGEELKSVYPYEITAVKGWWEVDGAIVMKLVPLVDWVSKDIIP